jgi:hypothetical protein
MVDLDFEKPFIVDVAAQRNYGSQSSRYYVERPVNQINFLLNYYNDSFFGASHDIKLGVEYADRNAYTESVYTGNMLYRQHYNTNTWDWNGDFLPEPPPAAQYENFKRFEFWRGYYRDYGVSAMAGYFSDTITFGRFNLLLGVRYDYQKPRVNPFTLEAVNDNPAWATVVDPAVKSALDTMLPALTIAEQQAVDDNGDPYFWGNFSPRLGLTWDVTGDGKTIAKASFSVYYDFMGMMGGTWVPYGTGGWMDLWWQDDGDTIVEFPELYWNMIGGASAYTPYRVFNDDGSIALTDAQWTNAYGTFWGGYDRTDPQATTAPRTTYSPDSWKSSRTTEMMLTLEREIMTDFSVTLNASYRKYDHYNWSNKYFLDAAGERYGFQSRDWYVAAPLIPSSLDLVDRSGNPALTKWDGNTGEAAEHEWYYMTNSYTEDGTTFDPSYSSAYTLITKQPDYYRDYYGLDLIFTKRLSNKWMFDANLTLQTQAQHYGDEGYWNSTNLWAVDGQEYAAYIGGASGKINQYIFSRWMAKASGLYQFPYDINFSFVFLAREGWIIAEQFGFVNYTLPNARSRSATLYLNTFGTNRLNTFYRLDVRLEKMIKVGDAGRIWIMADIFNVLNLKLENRRYQKSWGTYYYYGDGDSRNYFSPSLDAYSLNEVLNPRVMRLGIRFQF